jgi:hypothetical protein
MTGRLGAVAASVAIAAIGVVVYLNHHRPPGFFVDGMHLPPSKVLVATRLIEKGTTGDSLLRTALDYRLVVIPDSKLGSELVRHPILSESRLRGKVATRNLLRGQQLLTTEFRAVCRSR